MNEPSRQIHLDFHTSEHIPDVGKCFSKEQFKEAAVRAIAARKKVEDFDNPVSQSVNMLYGHISNVQVKHHDDKPLKLPHRPSNPQKPSKTNLS